MGYKPPSVPKTLVTTSWDDGHPLDPRLAELVHQLENASDEDLAFDPGALPSGDELALELERFLRERESDSGTP